MWRELQLAASASADVRRAYLETPSPLPSLIAVCGSPSSLTKVSNFSEIDSTFDPDCGAALSDSIIISDGDLSISCTKCNRSPYSPSYVAVIDSISSVSEPSIGSNEKLRSLSLIFDPAAASPNSVSRVSVAALRPRKYWLKN